MHRRQNWNPAKSLQCGWGLLVPRSPADSAAERGGAAALGEVQACDWGMHVFTTSLEALSPFSPSTDTILRDNL